MSDPEPSNLEELAEALKAIGCPSSKCAELAVQLDKRARQLSKQRQAPYEQALAHLLGLMREGWIAKGG